MRFNVYEMRAEIHFTSLPSTGKMHNQSVVIIFLLLKTVLNFDAFQFCVKTSSHVAEIVR